MKTIVRYIFLLLVLLALLCTGACGSSNTVASQSIGLTSVGNARELGGYTGIDGRTVKHGALLRTASLADINEEDTNRLLDVYHLSVVLDFRMALEVNSAPDPEIPGVKNLNLRIIDEEAVRQRRKNLTSKDMEGLDLTNKVDLLKLSVKVGIVTDRMYIDFLSADTGKAGYRTMFKELLALPEGKSLLFHCTQGKDRTGCAAMLILSALGVDEDTIMEDFLLTNTFNAQLIEAERKMLIEQGYSGEELDRLMRAMDEVNPQYMINALDWLKENYGSVTGYITQELGVTSEQLETLREKFLDD